MPEQPLRHYLDEPYSEEDALRVRRRVQATLRSRRQGRHRERRAWTVTAATAAATVLLAAGAVWYVQRDTRTDAVASSPASPTSTSAAVAGPLHRVSDDRPFEAARADRRPRTVRLQDGSTIALETGTRLEALENTGAKLALVLGEGRATFDVEPGGPRRWVIDASLVTVDVLGTRFAVERAPRHATVTVERGLVRVRGMHLPGGVRRLEAGESVRVELPEASAGAAAADDGAEPSAAEPSPDERPDGGRAPWRSLVRQGEYSRAFDRLGTRGFADELRGARDVETLLALADAARLSGHPAEAATPLARIVDEHPDDPRAAIASFTLARIELESLEHPARAARRFERAIELGLPPALREPAHVRAVEAAARAGDDEAAQAAAKRYAERFGDDEPPEPVARWLER